MVVLPVHVNVTGSGEGTVTRLAASLQATGNAAREASAKGLAVMSRGLIKTASAAGQASKPLLTTAANMRKLSQDANRISPQRLQAYTNQLEALIPSVNTLIRSHGMLRDAHGRFTGQVKGGVPGLLAYKDVLANTVTSLRAQAKSLPVVAKQQKAVKTSVASTTESWRLQRAEMMKMRYEMLPFTSAIQGVMLGLSAVNLNIRGVLFSLVFLGRAMRKIALGVAALVIVFGTLIKALTGTIKAMFTFGQESDKIINRFRAITRSAADSSKAWLLAQYAAVKYGRELGDVADAMELLTQKGVGNKKVLEDIGKIAVVTGKKMTEAAQMYFEWMDKDLDGIVRRYRDAYKDTAIAGSESLNRIRESLRGVLRIMVTPIWERFFGPILLRVANFVANLVKLVAGLWKTKWAQDHLNKSIAIFNSALQRYGPELRSITDFIKTVVIFTFKAFLSVVRGLALGFRFLMAVTKGVIAVFTWLGRLLKPIADMLRQLFPKELLLRFIVIWAKFKEALAKAWANIVKWWNESFKPAVEEFFSEHPIGIFLSATWALAGAWLKDAFEKIRNFIHNYLVPYLEENPLAIIGFAALALTFAKVAAPALWGAIGAAFAGIKWIAVAGVATLHAIGLVLGAFFLLDLFFGIKGGKLEKEWEVFKEQEIYRPLKKYPIPFSAVIILTGFTLKRLGKALLVLITSVKAAIVAALATALSIGLVSVAILAFLAGATVAEKEALRAVLKEAWAAALTGAWDDAWALLSGHVRASLEAQWEEFKSWWEDWADKLRLAFDAPNIQTLFSTIGWEVGQIIGEAIKRAIGGAIEAAVPGWIRDLVEGRAPTSITEAIRRGQEIGAAIAREIVEGSGIGTRGGVSELPVIPKQHGGSGVVNRPTLFLAGEAGAEAYSFTPLGGGQAGAGITVQVTISGNYIIGDDGASDLADIVAGELMNRLRSKYAIAGIR